MLLEQYDQPAVEQPQTPMEIWTVELQGLDVRNLANNILETNSGVLTLTLAAFAEEIMQMQYTD